MSLKKFKQRARELLNRNHGKSTRQRLQELNLDLRGWIGYFALEHRKSVFNKLDGRSDLFSLGVVLYEASTGVSPFLADSPFVTLDNIRSHDPQSACSIDADLPRWFSTILGQLLSKSPEKRFSSAQSLIDAFESQTAVEPKIAPPSNRSLAVLSSVGVTLLAAIVVSSFYFRKSDVREAPPVIPRTETTGFFVDQNTELFATLADAVEAAQDKSVIEVHGNGPFSTDTISITGKRLSIRAAAASLPRFVPNLSDEKSTSQFIHTDNDLQLEGLEILWPNFQAKRVKAPTVLPELALLRCLLGSTNRCAAL